MLFHVRMDVHLPADMPADVADEIKTREKAYSQELQRSGKWRHIWRLVGEYANVSVFDVQSNAELHDILTALFIATSPPAPERISPLVVLAVALLLVCASVYWIARGKRLLRQPRVFNNMY